MPLVIGVTAEGIEPFLQAGGRGGMTFLRPGTPMADRYGSVSLCRLSGQNYCQSEAYGLRAEYNTGRGLPGQGNRLLRGGGPVVSYAPASSPGRTSD